MGKWLSELDLILLAEDSEEGADGGRSVWRLDKPLGYAADDGSEYWVPAGFRTDLASVPKLPLAWLLAGGAGNRAATLHDWALTTLKPRRRADDLFLEALRASDVVSWRARLMWLAVRVNSILKGN